MNKTHLKCIVSLLLLAMPLLAIGAEDEAQSASQYAGTWLSIVPPLLAIAIALLFRNVIPALFIGLATGVWIIADLSLQGFFLAPVQAFETYVVNALADKDHASVILFSLMIGGMVGITSRNGGMIGIVNIIIKWANSTKRASLATIGMGMSIFFDDYANTLVVGNTMRPVTDKMKVSREKLAYLVDSTAAPIACIALITTWVGFEVGLIDDALKGVGYEGMSAYAVFLQTIPYSFYPILALLLTIYIASTGLDFGPMYHAEVRARNASVSSLDKDTHAEEEIQPIEDKPHRAINAILPIMVLIGSVMVGLYVTGHDPAVENQSIKDIVGNSNSYQALLWGSMAAVLVAALLSVGQGILTLQQTVNAWYKGLKAMMLAMTILLLAWSLSAVTETLQTSAFLTSLIEDSLSVQWLPLIIFLLSALTAFATGSSWGAMGILIPLVVPIVWSLMVSQGFADVEHHYLLYVTIASILAGAVWGDHCSPISDTTILSSMASGCDHIEHVRTQIPYAFFAGAFALILGIIPASFGVSPWLSLGISAVGMFFGLKLLGKKA